MELHLPDRVDVVVVLGSKSDQALAEKMLPVFAEFAVTASYHVCSAHRDHERLAELVPAAEARGAQVFIGVAGMAAHLPGVLAALTARPVIGVPGAGSLEGLDALLAIAQMPPGIPVACVAVGGGLNAALLAVQILAAGNAPLRERLAAYRAELRQNNRAADAALRQELGV